MPPGARWGSYQLAPVSVGPLGKGETVQAVTYQGRSIDRVHIPPTRHYMDLLIQGAYSMGCR